MFLSDMLAAGGQVMYGRCLFVHLFVTQLFFHFSV